MNLNPSIFRKYDIRGIVDSDLTDETVRTIGLAYGTFLKEEIEKETATVVIAGDARASTPRFIRCLTEGLNHLGIRVLNGGLVATPVLYFAVHNMDVDGGIMVTASHNPPEFNGFKMMAGTTTLSGDDIQAVFRIGSDTHWDSVPKTDPDKPNEGVDIETPYRAYFANQFPAGAAGGLRVVVDAGNGIAGPLAPRIFRDMGAEVKELYCEVDGSFPNHHPDPTVEANIADMIKTVQSGGWDAGIAFDGDGDRVGVVDDKGRIIWGDQLLALFAKDILRKTKSGTFIGEVKCSQVLYDEIEKAGGTAIMWKTGHSIIKRKMKEEGALLAGEMSGHLFFADRYFGFDDAMYAGARLLEMIRNSGQALSDIFDDLPKMISTPEQKVDCPDETKFSVIDNMVEAVESGNADLPGLKKLITIDGLRMVFEKGWSLIRASNTQPVLVLRFEAETEQALNQIRKLTMEFLNRHLNS